MRTAEAELRSRHSATGPTTAPGETSPTLFESGEGFFCVSLGCHGYPSPPTLSTHRLRQVSSIATPLLAFVNGFRQLTNRRANRVRASNSSLAAYPAHAHAYPILLERERSVAFASGQNGSSKDHFRRALHAVLCFRGAAEPRRGAPAKLRAQARFQGRLPIERVKLLVPLSTSKRPRNLA